MHNYKQKIIATIGLLAATGALALPAGGTYVLGAGTITPGAGAWMMDQVNATWGRGTLHSGAEGIQRDWKMKREKKSPGTPRAGINCR